MTPKQARQFIRAAVATETGKQALRALGLADVLKRPLISDDRVNIAVAEQLRAKLHRDYGF